METAKYTDKPLLRITGEGAEAVRVALIAKLTPPVMILSPFNVQTGPGGAGLAFAVSPHDSADFAADKILDALADRGWIRLSVESLTTAEEAVLRDRLIDLGYIE